MKRSESIAQLATALSAAQGKMNAATLNAVNPFLKNRYADLGAVIEAARAPLAENGLAFSQFATVDAGRVSIETLLMHASGEWMSETLSIPLGDNKGLSPAQVTGVALTYARRYSLAPMLGVYAGDDADGNDTETSRGDTHTAQNTAKQPAPQPRAEIPPMNLKPGGVDIPSKRAATNGEPVKASAAKRATIKTAHFGEIMEWAVKQGYVAQNNAAPFRLLQVAANYGYAEITDANLSDVRAIIKDHYEANKHVEQTETMQAELVAQN